MFSSIWQCPFRRFGSIWFQFTAPIAIRGSLARPAFERRVSPPSAAEPCGYCHRLDNARRANRCNEQLRKRLVPVQLLFPRGATFRLCGRNILEIVGRRGRPPSTWHCSAHCSSQDCDRCLAPFCRPFVYGRNYLACNRHHPADLAP